MHPLFQAFSMVFSAGLCRIRIPFHYRHSKRREWLFYCYKTNDSLTRGTVHLPNTDSRACLQLLHVLPRAFLINQRNYTRSWRLQTIEQIIIEKLLNDLHLIKPGMILYEPSFVVSLMYISDEHIQYHGSVPNMCALRSKFQLSLDLLSSSWRIEAKRGRWERENWSEDEFLCDLQNDESSMGERGWW